MSIKSLHVHRSVCGPFLSNLFDTDCVISPLLCVPKRDSDELRVVHDLSFAEGFSVNDGIAKDSYLNEPFRLRLPGIDRLVEFVNKEGRGCHVFKKDLSCAYRQIPVDPGDYHFLGFQVDGYFYFHSAFPFGLRSATLACQRTTQSVVYILNTMGILVDVYMDDFYGACKPSQSHSAFHRMNILFNELGLLASAAKDVPLCYRMVCLGVEIDTSAKTLTVPQFRLDELNVELHQWLEKSTYTKHALQSLLGKLSYVSACVRPGRAYMCRLLNALRDINSRSSARQILMTCVPILRGGFIFCSIIMACLSSHPMSQSQILIFLPAMPVYPVVARYVSVNTSSAVFLLPFWL